MSSSTSAPLSPSVRLTSLDQFRGYTMLGMILVNYLGQYKLVCPRLLTHTNDYCSYADTIMPQFFFAAGFALRLSLGRRLESGGKMPWIRATRRVLGLALVAVGWYSFCDLWPIVERFRSMPLGHFLYVEFKSEYFQTLLHIAATSLWILPVIPASARVRVGYLFASALLHFLLTWWFNFDWVYFAPQSIDGGPLGFLSWAIPALCGTLACDAVRASGPAATTRIASCGVGVMVVGWLLSCPTTLYNVHADQNPTNQPPALTSTGTEQGVGETPPVPPPKPQISKAAPDPVVPTLDRLRGWDGTIVEAPFVPPPDFQHRQWNYWMMSQWTANLSYTTFSAGLSLLIYSLFLWCCDAKGFRLGIFRTLGTNSLAAYMLHEVAIWIVGPWISKDTPSLVVALFGFVCVTLLVYGSCRLLEKLGWYIRV